MSELRIRNVTKRYGSFTAVKDFSLTVANGEFLSLLGPSGCGKTTLLRSIAGFFPISDGEITIGDTVVSSAATKLYLPPEKRNLGMVFQSYAVWPHMNVFDNVAYPLRVRKQSREEVRAKVERVLSLLNLSDQAAKNPSELSGGQQQRVALGRALVMDPDALLLDEPLSNLDAKLRDRMRFELKEIQRRLGLTIIYVTHDQDEAMAVSDRIVLMQASRIKQIGTPRQIYQQPENLFSATFIGRSNIFRGAVEAQTARGYRISLPESGASVPLRSAGDPLHAQGESVEVVVRYENAEITDKPEEDTIPAKTILSTYLGGIIFYEFETALGTVVAQTTNNTQLEEGEPVHLLLKDAHVFPAESENGAELSGNMSTE